ncbi:MAG TPA: PAS domain-containing protein [Syntrophales bacterium]|nr:PAS domain-containing protein [Syntrophales bacterium]HOD99320.1 PAS domain-containing protein [Syntrophales bacterium]HOH73925.1 PAS domain-containing protein [Syntrophales bacterium]HPX80471.1 PAS domain-containing protein [Syntrophales bacterium]
MQQKTIFLPASQRQVRNLLQSIVSHMLDALLILDWNGVILFANQAAAELVELDTTEAGIGRNAVEFIHPDFLETVFVDLINVQAGGGDIFNVFSLDGEQLALYMLNVSGHGVPSALVTVSVSQFLQPHRSGLCVPHGFLPFSVDP